jgi:hypothetical protein
MVDPRNAGESENVATECLGTVPGLAGFRESTPSDFQPSLNHRRSVPRVAGDPGEMFHWSSLLLLVLVCFVTLRFLLLQLANLNGGQDGVLDVNGFPFPLCQVPVELAEQVERFL